MALEGTSHAWSTVGPKWILGVCQGKRQINKTYVKTLGRYSGLVTFDLYVNEASFFTPGKVVTVTVMPEGGIPVQATCTIGQK
jgi:hypothetical protein